MKSESGLFFLLQALFAWPQRAFYSVCCPVPDQCQCAGTARSGSVAPRPGGDQARHDARSSDRRSLHPGSDLRHDRRTVRSPVRLAAGAFGRHEIMRRDRSFCGRTRCAPTWICQQAYMKKEVMWRCVTSVRSEKQNWQSLLSNPIPHSPIPPPSLLPHTTKLRVLCLGIVVDAYILLVRVFPVQTSCILLQRPFP